MFVRTSHGVPSPSMRRARVAVLALVALLVAGCTEADFTVESAGEGPDDVEIPDDLELVALDDIESFWEGEFPGVYGTEFTELDGGYHPYGPDEEPPDCGGVDLSYDDVADNAYYCNDEDLIAWDDVGLLADVEEDFGPLAAATIMAHEFGHAVQQRAVDMEPGVILELQADCFAGAWVADVGDRSDLFSTEGDNLENAIAGFLELSDALGTDPRNPLAHGSGFDRISAFQTGFDRGATACAAFETDPPPVVQMPFLTPSEVQSGGNLDTPTFLELYPRELDRFWAELFDRRGQSWSSIGERDRDGELDGAVQLVDPARDELDCGGETLTGSELEGVSIYCTDDNTVYLDGARLVPALEDIGDLAVGAEIARVYSIVAQERLGLDTAADLRTDCFNGVFVAALFNESIPGQQLRLSPGDLDEVLVNILTVKDTSIEAEAVDRITAFRTGFLDGLDSCPS